MTVEVATSCDDLAGRLATAPDGGLPVRPGPAHRQRRGGGRMTWHDDPSERPFALPQGQASSP